MELKSGLALHTALPQATSFRDGEMHFTYWPATTSGWCSRVSAAGACCTWAGDAAGCTACVAACSASSPGTARTSCRAAAAAARFCLRLGGMVARPPRPARGPPPRPARPRYVSHARARPGGRPGARPARRRPRALPERVGRSGVGESGRGGAGGGAGTAAETQAGKVRL